MTNLATTSPVQLALLASEVESANEYAAASTTSATKRAYAADMGGFAVWCGARGLSALPATPATVATYVGALADAGRKVSTIERAVAGIASAHRECGYGWESGPVRNVLAGIKRTLGSAVDAKTPVEGNGLPTLAKHCGTGLGGLRDRALLTLGWFGAFRRSELVALDVADVRFVRDGAVVTLRSSKTDQNGEGYEKGLTYQSDASVCPVRALRDWLDAAKLEAGPLFRAVDRHGNLGADRLNDKTVERMVKRLAKLAGLNPKLFAGHSLRAGFATTAAANGKSLDAIMRQTGHRSERVARKYIRHGSIFIDNATANLRFG